MKHSRLEHDERRRDGVLDLNLDRVREILGDSGHRKEIGRSDEEIAVE